jgi:hypothetical protein
LWPRLFVFAAGRGRPLSLTEEKFMLRGIVTLLLILFLIPLGAGCGGDEKPKSADPSKKGKEGSTLSVGDPLPPPAPLKKR